MKRDPLYPFIESRPGVLRRFFQALSREFQIIASRSLRKTRRKPQGYRLAQRSAGAPEFTIAPPELAKIGSKAA